MRDRRLDALGDLRVLPDEIICSIMQLLTPRDLGRLACVSRSCSFSCLDFVEFFLTFDTLLILRGSINLF